MAQVTLKQVTKSYGDVAVIPPLDLEISDKEFAVLVGPSGCGKTTTLRMVAGLEEATTGQVFIGDRDVTTVRPGLRNCAMVFQNYALYPHMSVRDNIAYGMRVRGEPADVVTERVEEAARILGLDELLHRRPKQLSGGQRQRVAIGRAIVRQPDVFLFDEPLSNLDAKLRIEMRTEIKTLHRRLQSTVIYVTHDQVEAMTLADRVVVMNKGVIEQAGAPIELYECPRNTFVAGFIGAPSMNLLQATLVAHGSGLGVRLAEGTVLPVPSDREATLAGGVDRPITFGLRPEHFVSGPVTGELTIAPTAVEPLGPHTLIIGPVGEQTATAEVDAHADVAPERPHRLQCDMTKAHIFDAATGRAL